MTVPTPQPSNVSASLLAVCARGSCRRTLAISVPVKTPIVGLTHKTHGSIAAAYEVPRSVGARRHRKQTDWTRDTRGVVAVVPVWVLGEVLLVIILGPRCLNP